MAVHVNGKPVRPKPTVTWGVPNTPKPEPEWPPHMPVRPKPQVPNPAPAPPMRAASPSPAPDPELQRSIREALDDDDEYITVRIPKAALERIVKETLMSNTTTAETVQTTATPEPTAKPAPVAAAAAEVATTIADEAKRPNPIYGKIARYGGSLVGGILLGVGGTLLVQKYGIQLGKAE